jgi:hypothetical protein
MVMRARAKKRSAVDTYLEPRLGALLQLGDLEKSDNRGMHFGPVDCPLHLFQLKVKTFTRAYFHSGAFFFSNYFPRQPMADWTFILTATNTVILVFFLIVALMFYQRYKDLTGLLDAAKQQASSVVRRLSQVGGRIRARSQ